MNNHRCRSQKSLITIRKWLLEADDGPSTSFCIPSPKLNHNKSYLNKIIKRKRYNKNLKSTSIIDWFYEFIKNIFTVYDKSQFKYNEQIHQHGIDDTTISILTCSTCQLENVDSQINTIQTTLKSNETNSILPSKMNPNLMITTATSSSNLNIPSSKSTQTQANYNEQPSTVYPLYCFSIKDGQILPLMLSSPSSSTDIPLIKELISPSSLFSINNKTSEYSTDPPVALPIPSVTSDNHSHLSYYPTIGSITRSDSNTISLQTIDNLIEDDISSKIHRASSSLHNTRICHFDKRNCLIECYHESNAEKYPSNFRRTSRTNTNTPEIIFAESTCHLIKQAWRSSTTDQ